MEQTNIRATIDALEVEQSATFPIARLEYVLSCRTRLQAVTGKKFASKRDKGLGTVVITRKTIEQ